MHSLHSRSTGNHPDTPLNITRQHSHAGSNGLHALDRHRDCYSPRQFLDQKAKGPFACLPWDMLPPFSQLRNAVTLDYSPSPVE